MEKYKVHDCWAGMNGIYFDTNVDGRSTFCIPFERALDYCDEASKTRVEKLLDLVDKR